MKGFIATQIVLSIATTTACQSASLTMQDEISAYEKSDYQEAMKIGRVLTIEEPQNSLLHYYLANAYVYLRRLDDARREYSLCQRLTEDLQLRNYCDQALAAMENRQAQPTSAYARAAINKASGSQMIERARNTIMGERVQLIDGARELERRDEENIERRMQDDINAVPRYLVFGRNVVPNPNYGSTVSQIKARAERSVQWAKQDSAYKIQKINESNQLKMQSLESSLSNTSSQFNPGSAGTQLAPGDAFPFVKNYLNFKPSPLPNFPARQMPNFKNAVDSDR